MKKRILFYISALIIIVLSCSIVTNEKIIETKVIPEISQEPSTTQHSPSKIPSLTMETKLTYTPTISETITKSLSPTDKPIIIKNLSSGRYIFYTREEYKKNKPTLYIVSEAGEELGMIYEGGVEYRSYLSPNQQYIAYNILNQVILFDIEKEQLISLPDTEDCFTGIGDMSWSPDSNELAIACTSNIIIVSITDGMKIGKIFHDISPVNPLQYFYLQWSPDGKWMAYYILADSQKDSIIGPIVTNTSCMTNPEGCDKSTKILMDASADPELIEWTPSSHLAVLDWRKKHIRIFNPESLTLLQNIIIPDSIRFVGSFSWSNDEEWIAMGSENGLFIMSIKTGEIKLISSYCYYVAFWYVVP
jgi:WD40 repeat protein